MYIKYMKIKTGVIEAISNDMKNELRI
jgi:hypothetical protein